MKYLVTIPNSGPEASAHPLLSIHANSLKEARRIWRNSTNAKARKIWKLV